ncbi:Uncharacterized protein APZ42_013918 [Daphnia magna]|uniref:Uncharacterized protein n=1 Tax=Daphnia magna TaxID=35525 RepID=A0A162QDM0_9CRUS|nr:Uncharacterized protein APZ42_013918 [Daphnia magna]
MSLLSKNVSTPSGRQQVKSIFIGITAALSAVNGIADSSAENNGAANRKISRHSTSSEQIMVQSVQGHILKIKKSDLKFAITIGRLYSGNLHLMVNKRLESVYTRTYMSEHLLPGMAPRAKKLANTPSTPVKPGLPKEDVVAISLFMIQVWKTYRGQVIKPNDARLAIRS